MNKPNTIIVTVVECKVLFVFGITAQCTPAIAEQTLLFPCELVILYHYS